MTTRVDRPMRAMMAAQIAHWIARLENRKDENSVEGQLYRVLIELPDSTFQAHHMCHILSEALRPYAKHAMFSITSEVADFHNRLWVAELYEQGGLNAVNMNIDTQLGRLKQALGPNPDGVIEAVGHLHDVLDAAIYLFPHEAFGIEITINQLALRDLERREAHMDYVYPHRYTHGDQLIKYRNALRELGLTTLGQTLRFPLTYSYTTEATENGERDPSKHPADHIAFTAAPQRITRTKTGLVAATLLWDPPVKQVHFEAIEIERIELTENRDFSPQIDMYWGERKVRRQPTHEEHYLRFRGFRKSTTHDIALDGMSDDEATACDEIRTSHEEALLWCSDFNSYRVVTAYLYDGREGEKVLYRVRDIPFDEAFEAGLLVRILRQDPTLMPKVDRFASDQIIPHLLTVPVHRITGN